MQPEEHAPEDPMSITHDSPRTARTEQVEPDPNRPTVIVVSPLAYLRGMWSILWTAFASPFTATEIDATTGRVIRL